MTLEIKGLKKSYGVKTALRGVSMTLTPGIYGLLGPNGAGKSTLMSILAGNRTADEGTILYEGRDILQMGSEFRRLLGYMPQQQNLYSHFTARRFLFYMAALKGMEKKQAKTEIDRLVKTVNLESDMNRRLGGFSGGMKQRILIAQAILGDPKVLVLDEPTAGLDPKERIRIRNLIAEIALDKIVLLATHVVSDIEYVAKDILLLKAGEVIAHAQPNELLGEMEGKVFEIFTEGEQLKEISARFHVGNIAAHKDRLAVRVVSDQAPEGYEYAPVPPVLEDVYLYRFEEAFG